MTGYSSSEAFSNRVSTNQISVYPFFNPGDLLAVIFYIMLFFKVSNEVPQKLGRLALTNDLVFAEWWIYKPRFNYFNIGLSHFKCYKFILYHPLCRAFFLKNIWTELNKWCQSQQKAIAGYLPRDGSTNRGLTIEISVYQIINHVNSFFSIFHIMLFFNKCEKPE